MVVTYLVKAWDEKAKVVGILVQYDERLVPIEEETDVVVIRICGQVSFCQKVKGDTFLLTEDLSSTHSCIRQL